MIRNNKMGKISKKNKINKKNRTVNKRRNKSCKKKGGRSNYKNKTHKYKNSKKHN